jgi:hypothetical protein
MSLLMSPTLSPGPFRGNAQVPAMLIRKGLVIFSVHVFSLSPSFFMRFTHRLSMLIRKRRTFMRLPMVYSIFLIRNPLKIPRMIIGFYPINMVNLWLFVRVGYKGYSHQAMNINKSIFTSMGHLGDMVAISSYRAFEDATGFSPYPTEVTYFVGQTRYGLPYFHMIDNNTRHV